MDNSIQTEEQTELDPMTEQLQLAKTLLTINEAYKETIDEKIANLRKKLELNQHQQAELIAEISAGNNHEKSLNKSQSNQPQETNYMRQNEIELNKVKSNYFKDRFNSEPADCIETLRKRRLNFYDYTPQVKPEWTQKYRTKLKVSVVEDAMRIVKLPVTQRISFLQEKINRVRTDSSTKKKKALEEIRQQLKEARSKLRDLEKFTEHEILSNIDISKVDWMKISKIDLESRWTSEECHLVWQNVCSPQINQEKWTQVELKHLIELARKFKEKNWEKICKELKTNRSAFLCMKRYHEKTVDKYCKRDWSDEETLELCHLAEQLRVGQYIPYNYLCYLNGTRDRNSIFNWHIKVDPNLNHGKWTPDEEKLFEEALLFYNTVYNWQEISEHVVTRTAHQCRDRYELKYHNPEKYINWTIEDDKKLIEMHKKYNGQWYKIAAFEFPNRNDNACLFRYTRLMAWYRQNKWYESLESEMQEFILFICKNKKKNINEPEVYTDDGILVPRKPMFAQNITNLIDQLAEKKDLIEEFIQKKRQGQLSLNLLSRIGIYTPALNWTIAKYKKHYLAATNPDKETSKSKTKTVQVKLEKEENKKIKREAAKLKKEALGLKSKKLTTKKTKIPKKFKKSMKIKHLVPALSPPSVKKSRPKLDNFNALLTKKRQKSATMQLEKMKMIALEKSINKPKPIKINDIFPNDLADSNFVDLDGSVNMDNNLMNSTVIPSEPKTVKTRKTQNERHIRNLISLEEKTEPQSEIARMTMEVTTPKKRGRKKKTLQEPDVSVDENEPTNKTKRSKKEIVRTNVISPISTKTEPSPNSQSRAMKDTTILNYARSLQEVELSPLVVEFTAIPNGEKIPCVSEQSSLFKFMYLLKKAENNANYFFKYTVIKYSDRYVAIKPFNSKVTAEYLNETRLAAITKILDQVFIKK